MVTPIKMTLTAPPSTTETASDFAPTEIASVPNGATASVKDGGRGRSSAMENPSQKFRCFEIRENQS